MILGVCTLWMALVNAMSPMEIAEMRRETVDMFYHGFDNYMNVAFPEDEVSALGRIIVHIANFGPVATCFLHTIDPRFPKSSKCGTE